MRGDGIWGVSGCLLLHYIRGMSHICAEIDTFYGDFRAEFDFSIDGESISGTYDFIGYHGNFSGMMTGEDSFVVNGVVDSYAGEIDFSITGRYDGRNVTGEGITGNKGRFSVRGFPIGEL